MPIVDPCGRCRLAQSSGEYDSLTSKIRGEIIKSCVRCVSPPSRLPLHRREVFKKPENMFLNYISYLIDLDSSLKNIERTYNIPEDLIIHKDIRFDLKLFRGKQVMIVEIDEENDHFTNEQKFHEDRKRENDFHTTYSGYKKRLIRIRVGDGAKKYQKINACIKRDGENCRVTDQYKFDSNMRSVINYIEDFFNNKKRYSFNHGYIKFFENDGILNFQDYLEIIPANKQQSRKHYYVSPPQTPHTKTKLPPIKETAYIKQVNKKEQDELIHMFHKTNLNQPGSSADPNRCQYRDGRGQCTGKPVKNNNYCKKHK